MSNTLSTLVFCAFMASWVLNVLLLARFIGAARHCRAGRAQDAGLRQLAEGSDDLRADWSTLLYVLQRRYAGIGDAALVRCGDHARVSFFVSAAILLAWAVAVLVLPP